MTQTADGRALQLLVPVKNRQPRWHLLGLPGIADLPAVRWKLLNLGRMSANRHAAAADSARRGPEPDRSSRAASPAGPRQPPILRPPRAQSAKWGQQAHDRHPSNALSPARDRRPLGRCLVRKSWIESVVVRGLNGGYQL